MQLLGIPARRAFDAPAENVIHGFSEFDASPIHATTSTAALTARASIQN